MNRIIDSPFAVFLVAVVAQWFAAYIGDRLRKRRPLKTDERDDFGTVLTATLTLFALIIGFSFSMAVSRYDQRRGCEEAEANAIGTEYRRADLLPADDASAVRALLRTYVDQRIVFYRGDGSQNSQSSQIELQNKLWSSVVHVASTQTTPIVALAVAGMNDVLNSQSFTEAAWLNRIPIAAWGMLGLIAMCSNILLGYRERSSGLLVLFILPVISSIAFFLIADIDSPYGGVIHITPYNLIATSLSIKEH